MTRRAAVLLVSAALSVFVLTLASAATGSRPSAVPHSPDARADVSCPYSGPVDFWVTPVAPPPGEQGPPLLGGRAYFTVHLNLGGDVEMHVSGANGQFQMVHLGGGQETTWSYVGMHPGDDTVWGQTGVCGLQYTSESSPVAWAPPQLRLTPLTSGSLMVGKDEARFQLELIPHPTQQGWVDVTRIGANGGYSSVAIAAGTGIGIYSYQGTNYGFDDLTFTTGYFGVQLQQTAEVSWRDWKLDDSGACANPKRSWLWRKEFVRACRDEPVNTASGSYQTAATDVSLPGIGASFVFRRSFSNFDYAVGDMGPGWVDSYSASLKTSGPQASFIQVRTGIGQVVIFSKQPDGSYQGPPGVLGSLSSAPGGGYDLTRL